MHVCIHAATSERCGDGYTLFRRLKRETTTAMSGSNRINFGHASQKSFIEKVKIQLVADDDKKKKKKKKQQQQEDEPVHHKDGDTTEEEDENVVCLSV